MTLKEFQAWIINHDQQDSWWVAIDGEVQDDLMVLPDVNRLKAHHPLADLSLLHVSRSEDENAEWETFEAENAPELATAQGASLQISESASDELRSVSSAPSSLASKNKSNACDRARQFFQRQLKKDDTQQDNCVDSELASNSDFVTLQNEVRKLKKELAAMQAIVEELKYPVSEARAMLEEREQFLEMSENSLFEKAQKQEVLQTELAQRSDDLDCRERTLMQREKAVG